MKNLKSLFLVALMAMFSFSLASCLGNSDSNLTINYTRFGTVDYTGTSVSIDNESSIFNLSTPLINYAGQRILFSFTIDESTSDSKKGVYNIIVSGSPTTFPVKKVESDDAILDSYKSSINGLTSVQLSYSSSYPCVWAADNCLNVISSPAYEAGDVALVPISVAHSEKTDTIYTRLVSKGTTNLTGCNAYMFSISSLCFTDLAEEINKIESDSVAIKVLVDAKETSLNKQGYCVVKRNSLFY